MRRDNVSFLGLFTILAEINKNAYRLDIPTSQHIHNIFHISLLWHHWERMTGVKIETQQQPSRLCPIHHLTLRPSLALGL